MGIPDRLYNIAKGQLDNALDRWEEIDTKAKQEIDSVLMNTPDTNNMSAWDRAVAKLNAVNAAKELGPASERMDMRPTIGDSDVDALEAQMNARDSGQSTYPSNQGSTTQGIQGAPQVQQQTLTSAYKVLGVEPGADWLTIRNTYQKLKERAAPERFPEGSKERQAAQEIQRRVDASFMILTNALAPASDRFDKLEF